MSDAFRLIDEGPLLVLEIDRPQTKNSLKLTEMEALGDASTRLTFNVNWMGATLPAENKQGLMAGQAANLEVFKRVCETNPA